MKISYLKEFIILSRYLNFSHAARQLHMTQPGLSRHIAALENDLGFQLLKRDTHKVRLTNNGEHFLNGIRKIIDDYDVLCESIRETNVKKLNIGIPYYGINCYLHPIVSMFETIYDNVKIDYFPSYPDEIITGLLAEQIDIAVLPKVEYQNVSGLVFYDAFKEPVVCMMHKDHCLASKKFLKMNDLENEKFIALKGDFGRALFEQLCLFFNILGYPLPKKIAEKETIEAAALSMKPEGGLMMLPGHFIESRISGNVTCLNLFDEHGYIGVSLVRKSGMKNPVIDQFIKFYLKQVRQNQNPVIDQYITQYLKYTKK